jgi:hypothetical protein
VALGKDPALGVSLGGDEQNLGLVPVESYHDGPRACTRAHQEAMKVAPPGCGENEIQARLEDTFRRLGGDRPGYGSIVGSGPNATILQREPELAGGGTCGRPRT